VDTSLTRESLDRVLLFERIIRPFFVGVRCSGFSFICVFSLSLFRVCFVCFGGNERLDTFNISPLAGHATSSQWVNWVVSGVVLVGCWGRKTQIRI